MEKKMKLKITVSLIINITVVIFLFLLPYIIFNGKLYVGGDDSRLMYSYPLEYFKNVTFFSWNHFSNFGWNFPAQSFVPFLSVWIFLERIFNSKIFISYLSFSLPLILGYVYFQKLIGEFLSKDNEKYALQKLAASMFYIFSPIIAYQLLFVFLTSAWLICLVPITFYYFVRYLKTSNLVEIIKVVIIFTFFAFVTLSVPWILGFLLPLFFVTALLFFLFSKDQIIYFLNRFITFFGILVLSQSFWLLGYLMTYIQVSSNSFAAKVFSQGFQDTFTPTIISTAKGNIFYPLFNLINRQMTLDFNWDIKYLFLNFFDKTILINIIFVFVLLIGITNLKKFTNKNESRIFIIFFSTFVLLLYLITVNIGALKELFIFMRHIPAFTMFRNFYDKFSLGFVFCYSVVVFFSLVIVKRKYYKSKNKLYFIHAIFILAIFINLIPIKKTVNAPVWQSKNTFKNITFPQEYLNFMQDTGKIVSQNNNLLSVPFGAATYTVVKDENSNSVYVGGSPVILFSGINDISGHLSFNFTKEADTIDKLIIDRKYKDFNEILFSHNINYLIFTKNVPSDLIGTYIFNKDLYEKQDKEFINSITKKKILTSESGNYELFELKKKNSLIFSNNLYFRRISPTKYEIYIKNLKNPQKLSYLDSFHEGWGLYLQKNPDLNFCEEANKFENTNTIECKTKNELFNGKDISYLWKDSVFEKDHTFENGFSNLWIVNSKAVIENFDSSYYKKNKDGSIDIKLILFFKPQSFFYLGTAISILVLILLFSSYLRIKIKK